MTFRYGIFTAQRQGFLLVQDAVEVSFGPNCHQSVHTDRVWSVRYGIWCCLDFCALRSRLLELIGSLLIKEIVTNALSCSLVKFKIGLLKH